MKVKNSLVKANQKQTFSAFLAQDAMKKKINEMVGGEKGQQFVLENYKWEKTVDTMINLMKKYE